MSRKKPKESKRTLLHLAKSPLYEEDISEENLEESLTSEIREPGNWEKGIEELNPIKRKEQVSLFKKLPSGLSPYEMMYGNQDNDFAYQND